MVPWREIDLISWNPKRAKQIDEGEKQESRNEKDNRRHSRKLQESGVYSI